MSVGDLKGTPLDCSVAVDAVAHSGDIRVCNDAGMSLGQAVAVLNRERHNGSTWREDDGGVYRVSSTGHDPGDDFTAFEAIAIAEKYERAWEAAE